MSKYIIEIPDDVQYVLLNGKADNKYYTAVRPVAVLEELNSDYINENFGELQDEAYQRGLEDAWEAARKIIVDTAHGGIALCTLGEIFGAQSYTYIMCENTAQEAIDKIKAYDNVTPSDRIEVGDEVISLRKNGEVIEDMSPWIVTYETKYAYQGFDACGMFHNNPKEIVRKTGKHYDIASILEAIRTHD